MGESTVIVEASPSLLWQRAQYSVNRHWPERKLLDYRLQLSSSEIRSASPELNEFSTASLVCEWVICWRLLGCLEDE